jgi:hypothetical protein
MGSSRTVVFSLVDLLLDERAVDAARVEGPVHRSELQPGWSSRRSSARPNQRKGHRGGPDLLLSTTCPDSSHSDQLVDEGRSVRSVVRTFQRLVAACP